MSPFKGALVVLLCAGILASGDVQDNVDSVPGQPETNGDDGGAFQGYNLGRYEKRSSGHSFVRFGKKDGESKGHSFMYFGKRSPEEQNIVELFKYLQRSQEPSWKRGHTIMRFGKRSGDKHNFIRFGKRSAGEDYDYGEMTYPEDEKRAGHSMMYFGKREPSEGNQKKAGHSMMYFGKRQMTSEDPEEKRASHSMMYFGKREDSSDIDELDKRAGHSMMYFGKRSDGDSDKRTGHSMMYFGKRGDEVDKRGGHSMMYFGKRDSNAENKTEKRGGHSMMYFGKREADGSDRRTGHSMMYFGKRDRSTAENDGSDKRAGHSMMYFGKRVPFEENESSIELYDSTKPEEDKRAKHDMLYFGKKSEEPEFGEDKRAHSMIHFGKRKDEDDRASFDKKASHSIIRFGKRQPYGLNQSPSSWLPSSGPLGPINSRYVALLGTNPKRRQVYDKKKHNMMHFGKRSVTDQYDSNVSDDAQQLGNHANSTTADEQKNIGKDAFNIRSKREVNESEDISVIPIPSYVTRYDGQDTDEDDIGYVYDNEEDPLAESLIMRPRSPRNDEPQNSKNIFLRFG